MTPDDDPVERALAAIATRADGHRPPVDRVAAVHRIARRNARVRAAGAGGAALALAGALAVGVPALVNRGDQRGQVAVTPPTPSVRPTTAGAFTLTVAATAGEGRSVTLEVTTAGKVGAYRSPEGPVPAAQTWDNLAVTVDWGDGSGPEGGDGGDITCDPGRAVTPAPRTDPRPHVYPRAGRYVVTVTAKPCAPGQQTTRTVAVTVR